LLNYHILSVPFQFLSFRLSSLVFLVTQILGLLALGLDWAGTIGPFHSSRKLRQPQRFFFLSAEDQFKSLISGCEFNFALPSRLRVLFCRMLHVRWQFEELGIEVLELVLLEGLFSALGSYMHNAHISQLCERELLNLITL